MDSNSDAKSRTHDSADQLEDELSTIEGILEKHLAKLEKSVPKDDWPTAEALTGSSSLPVIHRIITALKRSFQMEEFILKENMDLKNQLKEQQLIIEEIEMERDVLLQQVHAYLETNSSLRVRLEEQRCQKGTLQAEGNASLKMQIKTLENEKEKLSDSNLKKEKQIHKMSFVLEQTAKSLRDRETEILNRKNKENNLIAVLKTNLQKALGEKADLEHKLTEVGRFVRRPRGALKRCLSMDDVSSGGLNTDDGSIWGEAARNPLTRGLYEPFKNHQHEDDFPQVRGLQLRPKNPPVHTQLTTLRRGLVNVTKKLDALKNHLVSSGVIAEESNRKLKRKAKPLEEEEEDANFDEQKSGFKNLKNILQDAKNLNAKLENLREEKQKMLEVNKRRAGVRVVGKEGAGYRNIRKAAAKLKEATKDREDQPDANVLTEDEAFVGLMSSFFFEMLNDLRFSQDRQTVRESEEESEESEVRPLGEDGSGDNPLKKEISDLGCKKLKPPIARPKFNQLERV